MQGKGQYRFSDANLYTGDIEAARRHGEGVFISKNGGFRYQGNWSKGTMNGKGVATYKSGAQYTGEWKNGERNGFGKLTYRSGNYYIGNWNHDKKEGYGEMHWRQFDSETQTYLETEIYLGFWYNGKQNGFGRHIWLEENLNLEELSKSNQNMAKREFINRYEGMFSNGQRNGLGIFFYSNGSIYEGEWADDLKHGFAYFTDMNGNKEQQIFRLDKAYRRIDEPRDFKIFNTVTAFQDTLDSKQFDSQMNGFGSNIMQRSNFNNSSMTSGKRKMIRKNTKNSSKGSKGFKSGLNSKNTKMRTGSLKNASEQLISDEELATLQKKQEFKDRNLVNQVSNPYSKVLNLESMFMLHTNILQSTIISKPLSLRFVKHIKGQVEKVLMRSHSMLQKIFMRYKIFQAKEYRSEFKKFVSKSFLSNELLLKEENMKKLTHSMTFDFLFKILQQAHILTPEITKSSFQRLHYADERNQIPSNFDFYSLRDRIRDLKLKTYYSDYDEFRSSYSSQQFLVSNLPLNLKTTQESKPESKDVTVPALNIQTDGGAVNPPSGTSSRRKTLVSSRGSVFNQGPPPAGGDSQSNTSARSRKSQVPSRRSKSKDKVGVDNTLGIGLNQINEAEETEEDSLSKRMDILDSMNDQFESSRTNGLEKDMFNSKSNLMKGLSDISENEMSESMSQENIIETENNKLLDKMKIKDLHFSNFFIELSLSNLQYSQATKLEEFYQQSLAKVEKELSKQLKRSAEEMTFDENLAELSKLYQLKLVQERTRTMPKIDENDLNSGNVNGKKMSEQIDVEKMKNEICPFSQNPEFEISNSQNVVLYRNFIDALVRIVHFRECVQQQNIDISEIMRNLKMKTVSIKDLPHIQFYEYVNKLKNLPDTLEMYLKYRIKPLLEKQIKSEAIFGGKQIHQIRSLTALPDNLDISNEDKIMVERYPVSTVYVDNTLKLEDQFTDSKYSLNLCHPKIGPFKQKNIFKLWSSGEKFVQRVFFGQYSNLNTARGKIQTQLNQIYTIFGEVYQSLLRVRHLPSSDSLSSKPSKYERKDICWYQEYKTINLKSMISYLMVTNFIKKQENLDNPSDLVYSDEDILIQIMERYMDPDSTYTYAKYNYLFRIPHLQTKHAQKILGTGAEESSFTVSSHQRDNLKDIIGLDSLDQVSNDENVDRIGIINEKREEQIAINKEKGIDGIQGLSLKDLKNKKQTKFGYKQSQPAQPTKKVYNSRNNTSQNSKLALNQSKEEIKQIMQIEKDNVLEEELARTQKYESKKGELILLKNSRHSGDHDSSNNSSTVNVQYETKKARSIADHLEIDPSLINLSNSFSLENQMSPKFVENMVQKQKDLMSDYNFETLDMKVLTDRMRANEVELAAAKIRVLDIELSFNEFVESFMIYCFTKVKLFIFFQKF